MCSFTKPKGHRLFLGTTGQTLKKCHLVVLFPSSGLDALFLCHHQPPCFAIFSCKTCTLSSFFRIGTLSTARAPLPLDLTPTVYKADTLTMFPPEYSGDSGLSSPSGVVTGGVGMLIIAVVT